MSSNCTNTTIDIQNKLDEDGEIEKGSGGGRTTDDGGCVSDRELAAPKLPKEPPAPPPHSQGLMGLGPSLQVPSAALGPKRPSPHSRTTSPLTASAHYIPLEPLSPMLQFKLLIIASHSK